MAKRQLPSPETLRQLLRYEPETGKLFWRERSVEWFKTANLGRTWNTRYVDTEALASLDKSGYKYGGIFKRPHRAHRVIWAMETGAWPVNDIDHMNGIRTCNVMSNLREATRSQNIMNKGMQSNNTSGLIGVYFHKASGKWMARAYAGGKCTYLGLFCDKHDASAAYTKAAKEVHKEYALSLRPPLE